MQASGDRKRSGAVPLLEITAALLSLTLALCVSDNPEVQKASCESGTG